MKPLTKVGTQEIFWSKDDKNRGACKYDFDTSINQCLPFGLYLWKTHISTGVRRGGLVGSSACPFHSKLQQTSPLGLFCLWTLLPGGSAGRWELGRALQSWPKWQHIQGIDLVVGLVPLSSHQSSSGVWRVIAWKSHSIWKLLYSHIIPRESVIQGIVL